MVVHEAHQRGVTHIVVTNPMGPIVNMTIPQMQQAAGDGAYLELMYAAVVGPEPQHTISEYAEAIRNVGPKFCILGTDLGGVGEGTPHLLHPQALLDFMESLRKQGISTADINLMVKTNPALALGLK
jgi:microsomal dipeptidase-like Zn-dependent dipeptidase